jgi:hypothetical protein
MNTTGVEILAVADDGPTPRHEEFSFGRGARRLWPRLPVPFRDWTPGGRDGAKPL